MLILDKVMKATTPSQVSARWFVENSDREGGIKTDGQTFTLTRPHARFHGVYAGTEVIDVQAVKLPLDESVGVFPFAEATTADKAKESLLILAGAPLEASEANPDIHLTNQGDSWEVEILKGARYLRLRILDSDRIPEIELVEMR